MKNKFERNCPKCNTELIYSSKQKMNRANELNSLCRGCIGKIRSEKMKTYTHNNTSKECPSCGSIIYFTNKYKYERSVKNNSLCRACSKKDKLNPNFGNTAVNFGIPHSNETLKKMRTKRIEQVRERFFNGGQMYPNYNPSSIPIIEQKANELGITDLQHAENGCEFFISELGYWVDGYSKEKNIVIEYYEAFHSKQIEKDLKRQTEITNFLKCKFIIIKK